MQLKFLLCYFLFFRQILFAQLNYSFNAINESFVPLASGIPAALSTAFSPTKTVLDEGFSNNLPIGFTFQFNSINYSTIHLNTNGFAALGAPFLAGGNQDLAYEINELRSAAGFKVAIKPVLAPFWDNLALSSASDLTYLTEGTAPNRVFTAEWKNAIWQSGAAALSFQIKLYETSNIVEFLYQPAADTGGANKSASIGISSEKQQNINEESAPFTFLSLNSSASTAAINPSFETDNITTKPSTGQKFRFSPAACMAPSGINVSGYSTNMATLNWTAVQGAVNYQIAISNIDVEPISGSTITANQFTFNDLSENTRYYFYIKNSCGSAWNKFSFKTSTLASLPYAEGFEASLENTIPNNMTSLTLNNSFGDSFWQTSNLMAAATGTNKIINTSPFMNANSWLFTPAFNFLAGAMYNISYKISSTGGTNTMEVKFGNLAGEDFLTNLIHTDNAISNTSYQTKNFNFAAPSTGEFVIGFGNKTLVNNQILLLDDILVSQISAPLPLNLVYFNAKLDEENLGKLSWQSTNENYFSHFEIQKSEDAKMFIEIGKTFSQNADYKTNTYDYFDRNPSVGINYYRLKIVDLDGKFSYSPIEIIRVKDGIITELYPNPSDKEVYLRMKNTDNVAIKAYQLNGEELPIKFSVINNNILKINSIEPPKTGIYLIQITNKTETRVLKWMVR